MERNRPKLFAAKFARETSRTLRRKHPAPRPH
jgi:hypothetical protein